MRNITVTITEGMDEYELPGFNTRLSLFLFHRVGSNVYIGCILPSSYT